MAERVTFWLDEEQLASLRGSARAWNCAPAQFLILALADRLHDQDVPDHLNPFAADARRIRQNAARRKRLMPAIEQWGGKR